MFRLGRDCYHENDALRINNSQLESGRIRAEMQHLKLKSMNRDQYDENDASGIINMLEMFAVNVQVGAGYALQHHESRYL